MTRKRGTCVRVGLAPGDFPVPLFEVVANCITIRGSFVGSREDMAGFLAFAAEGEVKADFELQPLTAINDIFNRTRARQGGRPCRSRFPGRDEMSVSENVGSSGRRSLIVHEINVTTERRQRA